MFPEVEETYVRKLVAEVGIESAIDELLNPVRSARLILSAQASRIMQDHTISLQMNRSCIVNIEIQGILQDLRSSS